MTDLGHTIGSAAKTVPGKPVFKIPDRSLRFAFLRYAAWLTCLWLVVYGGANWITGQHDYRVKIWVDLELAMPFWPRFAAVYLSLFPMLWLSPFVLHEEQTLRRFAAALGWLIVASGVGFLLVPASAAYDTPVVVGPSMAVFNLADQLNLDYNMLPSLHVGMSVLCAAAYSRQAGRTATFIFWAWALAICASTLVTHQHHLADVVTGAALGAVFGRFAGNGTATPEAQDEDIL